MNTQTQNTPTLDIRECKSRLNGGRWCEIWQYDGNTQRRVQVLVFDEPSQYGIDGGCISKLFMEKHEGGFVSTEATYDRGWDKKPASKAAKALYEQIIDIYNK